MKYVFIGGIPTSGKSYLAEKISKMTGAKHIDIDKWREEIKADPKLEKWVNFFWDKDEEEYWSTTDNNQHWENLKNQSEAFWPTILKKIKGIQNCEKSAIFEAVNILPHLAYKDLDFKGVFLIGESFETVLERNKLEPRWGQTEKLQTKEAQAFWNWERPKYKEEAERYGFKTFSDPLLAEEELLRILAE